MFKPRWTILINGTTGVIRLDGYKTELEARYDASLWAREGYENIIIRKEKRSLKEPVHYFLLAILMFSPYFILAVLGL